jgi:hypothetical protein
MIKKWNEVVKVIANKAIGAIATHDISVPDYKQVSDTLPNKCFEVEIENDECILITNCVTVSVEIKVLLSL